MKKNIVFFTFQRCLAYFWCRFGAQDGVQKSTMLRVFFLIDLDRFLASWNGFLVPKLASLFLFFENFREALNSKLINLKKFKRANFGRFLVSKSDVNNDFDRNVKIMFFL